MYAPTIRRFAPRHWIWTVLVTAAVVYFTVLLMQPFQRMHERIAPWFRERTAVQDSLSAHPPAGPSQRIRK
jgi:hypothetical protein